MSQGSPKGPWPTLELPPPPAQETERIPKAAVPKSVPPPPVEAPPAPKPKKPEAPSVPSDATIENEALDADSFTAPTLRRTDLEPHLRAVAERLNLNRYQGAQEPQQPTINEVSSGEPGELDPLTADPELPTRVLNTRHNIRDLGRLGQYRIVAALGQGGQGLVEKAVRPGAEGVSPPVAIKSTLGGHPDDDRAFVLEAQVLSRLQHPNIIRIQGFTTKDDQHWLVMDFVEGWNLRSILEMASRAGRTLSVATSCGIAVSLCRALYYAYEEADDDQGNKLRVVHRDLKPENVLISRKGEVILTDFGIAKAIRAKRGNTTNTDHLKGTPSYMAPEQIACEPLDGRSDLYAVGILLYEMATGARAPGGEDIYGTLYAIMTKPQDELFPALQNLDERLRAILSRTLSRSREDRYQSGRELARALGDYLSSSGLHFDIDSIAEEIDDLRRAEVPSDLIPKTEKNQRHDSRVFVKSSNSISGVQPVVDPRSRRWSSFATWPSWLRVAAPAAAVVLVGLPALLVYGSRASRPGLDDDPVAVERVQPVDPPAVQVAAPVQHETTKPDSKVEEAKKLAQSAQALYDLGKFAEAISDWNSSYLKHRDHELLLLIAQAQEKQGKLDDAVHTLTTYLDGDPKAKGRAEKLLARVRASLAARAGARAAEKKAPAEPVKRRVVQTAPSLPMDDVTLPARDEKTKDR